MCDFIGRTNSMISTFKGVNRDTLSKIFNAQCCHYYGCQAWALNDDKVSSFYTCKAMRKLWYLPNMARSSLLPLLVESEYIGDAVI